MENKTRVFINRDDIFGRTWGLRLARVLSDGRWAIAQPMTFVAQSPEEAACMIPSTLDLTADDAQSLIDELWNSGFRPTEGTGSAGAMAAVQAHLKDLQRIVFKEPKK